MEEPTFLALFMAGPAGRLLAGLWGAIWGSFFNVLVVRLPAGESLVRPASHCRACGAPLPWYDNIPIVSYVVLRGRCRRCEARFSARYLLLEILSAALSLAMHQVHVVQGTAPIGLRLAQLVITSLFCGLLLAVAFIDLDSFRIPDAITYPGIPVAMGLSLFMGLPHLWDGVVGGVTGYVVIRVIADGYQLLTGRMGMGYGDAKLLAMIGGLLGWQSLLPTLFLASLQGSVIGISVLLVVRRRRVGDPTSPESPSPSERPLEDPRPANADAQSESSAEAQSQDPLRHARIPFGPFLTLAAVELLLLRNLVTSLFPF
jgi:leader peptidase (prepilin peptidase)/N-methyltransferase